MMTGNYFLPRFRCGMFADDRLSGATLYRGSVLNVLDELGVSELSLIGEGLRVRIGSVYLWIAIIW